MIKVEYTNLNAPRTTRGI